MNAATLPSRTAAPRRTLLLILILALLPILTGIGLYRFDWRPAQTSNHGTLIDPPQAVSADPAWTEKWSLVLIGDAPCGAACAERLDGLRRVRVALAKDMARTRHVWVGAGIATEAAPLTVAMPDLYTVDGRLSVFATMPAGSVVIVDPRGMAMMRYAPGAELKGIRSDLERLLRYSWTG
jgi:hypothetical protein